MAAVAPAAAPFLFGAAAAAPPAPPPCALLGALSPAPPPPPPSSSSSSSPCNKSNKSISSSFRGASASNPKTSGADSADDADFFITGTISVITSISSSRSDGRVSPRTASGRTLRANKSAILSFDGGTESELPAFGVDSTIAALGDAATTDAVAAAAAAAAFAQSSAIFSYGISVVPGF